MLVAGGIDPVSVKEAMGPAQLMTTSRYLHVRPATDLKFTEAMHSTGAASALRPDPPIELQPRGATTPRRGGRLCYALEVQDAI